MSKYKKQKFSEDSNDDEFSNDYDKEMNDKIDKILNKKKTVYINEKVNYDQEEEFKNEFFNIILEMEEKLDIYLDYDKILKDFKNSIIDHNLGMKNRCTECNVDIGISNPRQLCGKTRCYNQE